MKRISVIGTVHQDSGLANALELLGLLKRIKPEVIFLEIPVDAPADLVNSTDRSLEANAVSRYRENHRVRLVPVDLPTPPASFFTRGGELSGRLQRASRDYCRVLDAHSKRVREGGFAFLNSGDCIQSWEEIYAEEVASLKWIGNPRDLLETAEMWRATNELREEAMIRHIEENCQAHSFTIGVLLVGAAHRGGIMDKVRAGAGRSRIEWDFEGFLAAP